MDVCMEREWKCEKMVRNMKASSKMEKKKVQESRVGLKVIPMKVCGQIIP